MRRGGLASHCMKLCLCQTSLILFQAYLGLNLKHKPVYTTSSFMVTLYKVIAEIWEHGDIATANSYGSRNEGKKQAILARSSHHRQC